jgi:hypothetical protein
MWSSRGNHASDKQNCLPKVVEALIESKSDQPCHAVGSTLSKFGTRAVLEGETLVTIINGNAI